MAAARSGGKSGAAAAAADPQEAVPLVLRIREDGNASNATALANHHLAEFVCGIKQELASFNELIDDASVEDDLRAELVGVVGELTHLRQDMVEFGEGTGAVADTLIFGIEVYDDDEGKTFNDNIVQLNGVEDQIAGLSKRAESHIDSLTSLRGSLARSKAATRAFKSRVAKSINKTMSFILGFTAALATTAVIGLTGGTAILAGAGILLGGGAASGLFAWLGYRSTRDALRQSEEDIDELVARFNAYQKKLGELSRGLSRIKADNNRVLMIYRDRMPAIIRERMTRNLTRLQTSCQELVDAGSSPPGTCSQPGSPRSPRIC